jgi:hypothetical protein
VVGWLPLSVRVPATAGCATYCAEYSLHCTHAIAAPPDGHIPPNLRMAFREDHLEAARDRFGTSGLKPRVGYRGPAFFKSCISGDLKSIDKYLASKGTDASGKSTVVDDMDDLGCAKPPSPRGRAFYDPVGPHCAGLVG